MQQPLPAPARRWFVRHLPDACLAAALLVVLALSVEKGTPGRTDWVDAARQAVSGQVGASVPGPAIADRSQRPAAVAAPKPG